MKKRERRRYLTDKYQQRQVRLAYQTSGTRPYDPYRYLQRPLAIKKRFLDELMGVYVGMEWDDYRQEGKTRTMLRCARTFSPLQLGRMRRQSFSSCGRSRCGLCSNPRRGYGCSDSQLTRAEELQARDLREDLARYRRGDLDDELSH